jgi:hypothetical protein
VNHWEFRCRNRVRLVFESGLTDVDAPRPVAGNENSPAPTDCANVIVAFSSESDLTLSHGAACAAGVRMIMIVRTAKKAKPTFRPTVAYSYFGEMVEVQCVAL